jgi:hypothetical protein
MATSNFHSMEKFPLWVTDDDDFAGEDDWSGWSDDVQRELDPLNETLKFYSVSLKSGYYSGCQLYVTDKYEIERYGIDEDDARYNLGMTVEEATVAEAAEVELIKTKLKEIGEDYGMFEIMVMARASNGETFYEKVEQPEKDFEKQV